MYLWCACTSYVREFFAALRNREKYGARVIKGERERKREREREREREKEPGNGFCLYIC